MHEAKQSGDDVRICFCEQAAVACLFSSIRVLEPTGVLCGEQAKGTPLIPIA